MDLEARRARSPKLRAFAICGLTLIACLPSTAAQWGPVNDEFGIIRDFATVVLSDVEVKDARIFVDIERLVVPKATASENDELRQIAIANLGAKFRLVAKKEDANYLVQIRMEEYVNYAIRNPRREPAQGFVMSSICKYPIGEIDTDCGNTEYDFFYKGKRAEIFKRFFEMWVQTLTPGSK